MAGSSGGVGAAFGFRYQYLVTVELLLDLYVSSDDDWRVAVDLHGQDSADILVYRRPGAHAARAVQVKGSLPSSTTSLGLPELKRLLSSIEEEHPAVLEVVVVTNRRLTSAASNYATALQADTTHSGRGHREVDARVEGLREVTARIMDQVARMRRLGSGGLGSRVHHLLVASLLDLVHHCGAQSAEQVIDRTMIASILGESPAALADALGARGWGLTYGVPVRDAIDRAEVSRFLSDALRDEALTAGVPSTAVVCGLSGAGKSAAVGVWSASRREHYALTLWLDASSATALARQLPSLLRWLDIEQPRADADADQALQDVLSGLPVPWLLVLDGAEDHAEIDSWIPRSGYGHTVITTNRADWPVDLAPQRRLEGMSEAEAAILIARRLDSVDGIPGTDRGLTAAVEFGQRLGMWPLAIDLACSWVRSLGGDLSRLSEFGARLHRWNLGEQGSQLASYPRSIAMVVDELWAGLSESAQAVLAIVIASGGSEVPVTVVEQWAAALPASAPFRVNVHSALDELTSKALMTRRLRGDVEALSHLDVSIDVHDGIRVALLTTGVEAAVAHLYVWLECCDAIFSELMDAEAFAEAQLLVPAITGFLENLIGAESRSEIEGSAGLERSLLRMATTLMNNLGSLAMLAGFFDLAYRWLTIAVNIRLSDVSEQPAPQVAALQIQTLALLAQVLVKQRRYEEIHRVAVLTTSYAKVPGVLEAATGTLPVTAALGVVRECASHATTDTSEQLSLLDELLAGEEVPRATGGARIESFVATTRDAARYAESEQWSQAVDTVLTAAAVSARDGVLLYESVEAVLDTGLQLIHSMLVRPHLNLPPSWQAAMRRLTDWCGSVERMDASQEARLDILESITRLDVEAVRRAVDRVSEELAGDSQIEAWAAMGTMAAHSIESANLTNRLLGPDKLPHGLTVVRGAYDSDVRWTPMLVAGQPALAVYMPAVLMIVDGQETDPLRNAMVEAGFPDSYGATGRVPEAAGWTLVLDGDSMQLLDGRSQAWLSADIGEDAPMGGRWREMVVDAGGARVFCRDPADLDPAELLATPVQALVPVTRAGAGRTSADDSVLHRVSGWLSARLRLSRNARRR